MTRSLPPFVKVYPIDYKIIIPTCLYSFDYTWKCSCTCNFVWDITAMTSFVHRRAAAAAARQAGRQGGCGGRSTCVSMVFLEGNLFHDVGK